MNCLALRCSVHKTKLFQELYALVGELGIRVTSRSGRGGIRLHSNVWPKSCIQPHTHTLQRDNGTNVNRNFDERHILRKSNLRSLRQINVPDYEALTFALMNVRSINNKVDEVYACCLDDDIDIATITETWLSESAIDGKRALNLLTDYSFQGVDRNSGRRVIALPL